MPHVCIALDATTAGASSPAAATAAASPSIFTAAPPRSRGDVPDIHELSCRSASPHHQHPDLSSHSWFPVTRRHAQLFFSFFFLFFPHSAFSLICVDSSPVATHQRSGRQGAFKFQFGDRQTVCRKNKQTNKKSFGTISNILKKHL